MGYAPSERPGSDPTAEQLSLGLDGSTVENRSDAAVAGFIELRETDPDVRVERGFRLQEAGDLEGAAECYRAALRGDPTHATAAFNLGVALEDLGRIEESISAYRCAVASAPDFADAHYNLSRLHEAAGDGAAALRHLSEYRKLAGSAPGRRG